MIGKRYFSNGLIGRLGLFFVLVLWTGCGGEEPAPPVPSTPGASGSAESGNTQTEGAQGETAASESNDPSVEEPKEVKPADKPVDNDGAIPGLLDGVGEKKKDQSGSTHWPGPDGKGDGAGAPDKGRFDMPRGPDFSTESTDENPFPMSQFEREMMRAMGRPSEHELRTYSLPLNNPPVVPAAKADHMKDDEAVLGVLVGEEARAYPWWIVIAFHVINDTFSNQAVYVAQCEVCSGAGAFLPIIDGWILDFRVCGGLHGTFYVCDFQTKSSWYSFSGVSFKGPLQGRKLERLPAYQTTWGEWKKLHPHTTVIHATRALQDRPHGHGQYMGKPVVEHQLEMTIRHRDPRLVEHELVMGLFSEDPKKGRVYPIKALRKAGGLVQEIFADKPVLIWLQGEYRVSAYSRTLDGKTLEFSVSSQKPFRAKDKSGSVWDEWGTALSGPYKGKSLALADGYVTEWYEWIGHYPGSSIFGK